MAERGHDDLSFVDWVVWAIRPPSRTRPTAGGNWCQFIFPCGDGREDGGSSRCQGVWPCDRSSPARPADVRYSTIAARRSAPIRPARRAPWPATASDARPRSDPTRPTRGTQRNWCQFIFPQAGQLVSVHFSSRGQLVSGTIGVSVRRERFWISRGNHAPRQLGRSGKLVSVHFSRGKLVSGKIGVSSFFPGGKIGVSSFFPGKIGVKGKLVSVHFSRRENWCQFIFPGENWAGSPRAVARPGFPQIRTCPIKASGSSCHVNATGRHTEWTAIAGGSGWRFRKRLRRSQVIRPPRRRRDSQLPDPRGRDAETVQCRRVAGDPVVREVAHELLTQRPVLGKIGVSSFFPGEIGENWCQFIFPGGKIGVSSFFPGNGENE